MRRLLLAGVAAVTAAATLALGGVLREDAETTSSRSSARELVTEATASLQRVRETGDPAFYRPAERSLRQARELEPRNGAVLRGLASLAASRHRFAEALPLARRAVRLEPDVAAGYGLVGDAALELGRYEQAFAAYDRQAQLKPAASAYARVAYARELLGDLEGAREAMRFAVEASAPGEPAAWARVQLGNLVGGERLYREALAIRPEYAPALEGLADQALRRGDRARRDRAAPSRRCRLGRSRPAGGPRGRARACGPSRRGRARVGSGGGGGATVRRVRRPQRPRDGRVRPQPRPAASGRARACA